MTSSQTLQVPRSFRSFTIPLVSCHFTDIHLANTNASLSGILNTGLFIAVARSTIVESFEQSYRRRRHLMRERRRLHQQEAARLRQEPRGVQFAAIAQAVALTQATTGITTNDGAAVRADASGGKVTAESEAAAYTKFREEMAKEEIKEFRAKLWVALGLFIAVWLIGSAIFMATESWGFGTAMYFCKFP